MKDSILVVDDNPANIQLIASILDNKGYEVEVASSGIDAIDALKDRGFDLVLLDVMMPELDGYDTCVQIKQNQRWKNLPVIFLTAKTDDESISKGFASGGVDYVTKPFNADELIARAKTHIELKKNREILEQKVKERTAKLAKANEELQTLDDAKNEFINIISHEIRTPLNGILGPLQLMNMEETNSGKVSVRMKILNESVERLESFSTKMVLISELRTKRYRFESSQIQLSKHIDDVLETLKETIQSKSLNIKTNYENDFIVNTDRKLLSQLFFDVIDNAVRLSPEKAEIRIEAIQNIDQVQLTISDQAGGLNSKAMKHLFKPFVPGDKFVNNNMGIGLYLAKLIAAYINGTINIQNIENGVKVSLSLPL